MPGSAALLASNFNAASATTITVSATLTVGRKYAIGVIGADVGSTVSAADTLSNAYTHRGSVVEAAIARRHHGLTCDPATGGATTITVTFPASADNRQVYVYEVQDVGNFDVFGTATDTGNNPTDAASATNTAQPAFMLAASIFYQGGTPTVGTIGGSAGVDEGTIFVGSGMLIGRGESQSVSSVGSQSANFGNSAFDRSTTLLWIFLESAPPTISAHPSDQTVNDGATATFSVTATGGATPYTYQWQDNSSGSFADIGGATSSSYGPTAAYSMQGRQYRCVVTGANSLSATSNAATLRVAYKLTGTGPRVYPGLGATRGAGSFESFLRGTATGGGADFTYSPSGGITFGGAATTTFTRDYLATSSGGLTFAGAATALQSRNFEFTSSGGIQLGGDATETFTRDYAVTSSGGVQFGGAASATAGVEFTFSGSGGLTFGGVGTTAYSPDYVFTSSGGIVLGGTASAVESNDYVASSSGGVQFGGTAAAQFDAGFVVTGSGGLQFAGAATATPAYDYTYSAAGGIQFGGAATTESSGSGVAGGDMIRPFMTRRRGR